jgi:signal transduction histidine kinase
MRYFLLQLVFLFHTASAQQYKHLDTITNPEIALSELYKALLKDPSNPELFIYTAQRKLQKSEYDSCIFYCNGSIELLTKKADNVLLIKALHTKGIAQYYLDDKQKAEENWRQALQLATINNEWERIIKLSSNLGAIYLDKAYHTNNTTVFSTADSFFRIAHTQLKAKDSLASEQGFKTLRLMATSLQFQKKYDSANYYYEKVISLSRGKYTTSYLGALSFYAESLSETGNHTKAIEIIKEAADFVSKNDVPTKDKTHIMHIYAGVLSKAGNYKDAYQFIDSSYYLLADDYQKVNAKAYAESESKFKNQILQYRVELEQQKKNRLYYLIGGLVLLTAFVILWLQNKNNKRIAQEKARQKQISIDAFIEGEEKEKVRIGRELHDGIAQEIVGIKLAMQQQNADATLINELTRISHDIRNISHELMPQTLKDFGLKIAVEDICQKILGPSGIQYEVDTALPDERMPHKIEITLYRVFQELVHNIIKHSQATEVLVQLRKMNTHVLLVVEDNGKGFINENKRGIGINNLKSRIQLLDGNIQYESGENEGTTAIVRVPV